MSTSLNDLSSVDHSSDGTTHDSKAAAKAVEFAHLIGKLKTTPRTGWVRRGVPKWESVADHSWRVAALSLLAGTDDNNVNVAKCMQMSILHDLAECIVGDIAPDDNVTKEDKRLREEKAIDTIADMLRGATSSSNSAASADYLLNLVHEYETRESMEAKVVKDLDLLDMILQADEYERAFDVDLDDFFTSAPVSRFQTKRLARVAKEVHDQRTERLLRARQEVVCDSAVAADRQLSAKDQAFVNEFSQASNLSQDDICSVMKALRGWEDR